MRKLQQSKSFMRAVRGGWTRKLSVQMPFIGFLCLLGVIYIGNSHTAERKMRMIEYAKKDLKEAQWEYMTLKAELMKNSTKSGIAKELTDKQLGTQGEEPKIIDTNKS